MNISQRVTPRAQTSEAGEKMLSVRASTASHLEARLRVTVAGELVLCPLT